MSGEGEIVGELFLKTSAITAAIWILIALIVWWRSRKGEQGEEQGKGETAVETS